MKPHSYWIKVSDNTPWSIWWPQICKDMKWPVETTVEKWPAAELSWSRLLDSAKTLGLFAKFKVIVILQAEKALKTLDAEPSGFFKSLEKLPHKILFVSDSEPPKSVKLPVWIAPEVEGAAIDDKAAFKWIDGIHSKRLSEALDHLENALEQDSHPLALLQLISRDLRLGRLIQYAQSQRLREDEIIQTLKLNPYAFKKWQSRKSIRSGQWTQIFERLSRADLDLKSGHDQVWIMRKLSFDLIEILSGKEKDFRRTSLQSPSIPLLTAVPSFA